MTGHISTYLGFARMVMQQAAFYLLIAATLAAIGYTLACAAGLAPWYSTALTFGTTTYADAGMAVQLAFVGTLLAMSFFLPTNARVMRLEASHRSFQIGMQDVARAYAVAHAADRQNTFTMSREFDAVRERMAFLRDHPDLTDLEPSVLEVAAQMSHISTELAQTYSDDKVSRARDFLFQRQQEIDLFNDRVDDAKAVANDIRRWTAQVEIDESIARAQLDRLHGELSEVMDELERHAPRAAPPEPTVDPTHTVDLPPALPHPDHRPSVITLPDRRAAE